MRIICYYPLESKSQKCVLHQNRRLCQKCSRIFGACLQPFLNANAKKVGGLTAGQYFYRKFEVDVAEFGVIERDDGDKKKLDRFPKGHRVSIFLTDDELKKIEIMSGLSKMKKPKAIKKLAFSNLENFTAMLEMKPTLDKFYNELGKQGVNLNQAVKRLNRGEKTPDILETIKKTNDMIGEILRIRIAITAELNRKRL